MKAQDTAVQILSKHITYCATYLHKFGGNVNLDLRFI